MEKVNDKLSIKNVEIDVYYDKALIFKISHYIYTYMHWLCLQSEIGIG